MKRLSINIEQINIRGGAHQLSEIITSIDNELQRLCQETESITSLVIRYSATNQGQQYKKMAEALMVLRSNLHNSSFELNQLQNDIVNLQKKILRYEDLSENVLLPNKYIVESRRFEPPSSNTRFDVYEMRSLSVALRKYSGVVYQGISDLVRAKNTIASFWNDKQYMIFAEFIDELNGKVMVGLREFGAYVEYLDNRIKELS